MVYSKLKYSFLVLVIHISSINLSYGQTFGEFFNQKKTQKRYLMEQIAALQVYIGYAKKGYEIAGSGLQTIRDITSGEFSLHDAFISSLKQVSPAIRNNAKIAEIIALQIAIGQAFGTVKNNIMLSPITQLYLGQVRDYVMEESGKDLEELLLIVTSGKLEMSDQERLERLDKVYASMKEKSAFVQDFCNNVNLLIRQKTDELQSIDLLKKSYELH